MTYNGRIQGGVVVLERGASLPEGTEVRVEPVAQDDALARLRDDLLSIAGTITGLPPDMAENHDHYIHGTPRK